MVETTPDDFLNVLKVGKISTNVFLRRLHNFAFGMNWLLAPIIPRNAWPKVEFSEKRAITADEHRRIIERERNPERKAFYEMCWHVGGSQTDMATLTAENIDWNNRTLSYFRVKTGTLGDAIKSLTDTKYGANKERWERAKDHAMIPLLLQIIIETKAKRC